MSHTSVPLRSIMPAFQGLIPSPLATVSPDGTPNITYVSVVRLIDDDRIAVSNQFLGKSVANLKANPSATVRVVDPEMMLDYDLDVTWLRSEFAGELYESMRAQVEAIASQTGMAGVFRLRAAEVFRVERCRQVRDVPEVERRFESNVINLNSLTFSLG